jgi:hypothetical protein
MLQNGAIELREDAISTWDAFRKFADEYKNWKNWCFRGQSDWTWSLETTLKRTSDNYGIENIQSTELGMIRRFKREYRQYANNYPDEDDYIQWLSIMRHHGAPTRLLDITYSIYIGLYFALINTAVGKPSALWCINANWLNQAYDKVAPRLYQKELRRDKRGIFTNLFKIVLNDRVAKVYVLNPYEMPERLTRQNGGFLVPMDITNSFFHNLCRMDADSVAKPWIIKQKLQLNGHSLKQVFHNLYRMNITGATLFPGIDGFADSLKMLMTIPEATYSYTDRFE